MSGVEVEIEAELAENRVMSSGVRSAIELK